MVLPASGEDWELNPGHTQLTGLCDSQGKSPGTQLELGLSENVDELFLQTLHGTESSTK